MKPESPRARSAVAAVAVAVAALAAALAAPPVVAQATAPAASSSGVGAADPPVAENNGENTAGKATVTAPAANTLPPYPLQQALADALARNPAVAVGRAGREAAQFQTAAASWARFPTVSADVLPATTAGNGTSVLRVDQPLWTGGRIEGQIAAARAGEDVAGAAEHETVRALLEQVAVTYYAWLGATERLALIDDGRAIFERLLATVERRQAAGAAAASDVTVARARLAVVNAQRAALVSELERARSELQAAVVGPLGAPQEAPLPPLPYVQRDEIEAAYLGRSATLARRRAELEAARATARVTRAQIFPTVSLRAERLQQSNPNPLQPNDTRALIAVTFAPGAGLASAANARAADARVQAAEDQVRLDEIDVRLRARTQWEENAAAQRQIAELSPQIEALQSTVDSYLRQYDAGRRSWLDVLNTYREVLDTRVQLSRTRTQLQQSAARLLSNTEGLAPWNPTVRP